MKTTIHQQFRVCALVFASATAAHAQIFPALMSDSRYNTAIGTTALHYLPSDNYPGQNNTALGYAALYNETYGNNNTATGNLALCANTTGGSNTASGSLALYANRSGDFNTASGYAAIYRNTSGDHNTANGNLALCSNSTGACNTASGSQALHDNRTGRFNTAHGYVSLYHNTTGYQNTALGVGALRNSTTGHDNIAIGYEAGSNQDTGSFNIQIGNFGRTSDDRTIRIGRNGVQTRAYFAGIYQNVLVGRTMVVDSNGRLGVMAATTARTTTDATPMARNTDKLALLRPVTFCCQGESGRVSHYGLVAEEVAKVYPELVIQGEDGAIDGVRYEQLVPLLLKESQTQAAELRELRQQLAEMRAFKAEVQALLHSTQADTRQTAER